METINPVLARKIGAGPKGGVADAPEGAASPLRKMRRALSRAADKAVGLSASVLGMAEELSEAEALIEDGPEGWVVLGLRDDSSAGLSGLFLMDPALRSALVEMQTIGSLLPVQDQPRKVTRTDAVMTIPFASRLMAELDEAGFGEDGLQCASYDLGPMDDLRTAGLVMLQGRYRSWRVTIQMGGEAQGELLIALRPKVEAAAPEQPGNIAWSKALRAALAEAPTEMEAVLTRMALPYSKIEAFEVGQVLTLAGTTVNSVTLTGPGGEPVAAARLGQVAGKRAVRIEQAEVTLQDAPPRVASPAPPPPTVATGPEAVGSAVSKAPEDEVIDAVAEAPAPDVMENDG